MKQALPEGRPKPNKHPRRSKQLTSHKDLALLSNSVLLGWLAEVHCPDLLELSPLGVKACTPRYCPDVNALINVLSVAGELDAQIANALTRSGSRDLPRYESLRQSLIELLQSNALVAKVNFYDLGLEIPGKRWGRLSTLLSSLDEQDNQLPVAKLPYSDVVSALREFVFEYILMVAAKEVGLPVAAAKFIGVDGLVAKREALRPMSWEEWNSPAKRALREKSRWAESMLKKARLHLWSPVQRLMHHAQEEGGPVSDRDVAKPFGSRPGVEFDGLTSLGFRFIEAAGISDSDLTKLFPIMGKPPLRRAWKADADPFTMSMLFASQIGLRAVQKNCAFCVAINDGVHAIVPGQDFADIGAGKDLWLPEKLSEATHLDLENELAEKIGAEKLGFVTSLEQRDGYSSPRTAGQSKKRADRKPKARGFLDAPFIEEARRLLDNGVAGNPYEAVKMVVREHGVRAKGDPKGNPNAIVGASFEAVVDRLYKKLRDQLSG